MADKTLKVTLRRSLIGEKPKARATIESLGLRTAHDLSANDVGIGTAGYIRRAAEGHEADEVTVAASRRGADGEAVAAAKREAERDVRRTAHGLAIAVAIVAAVIAEVARGDPAIGAGMLDQTPAVGAAGFDVTRSPG